MGFVRENKQETPKSGGRVETPNCTRSSKKITVDKGILRGQGLKCETKRSDHKNRRSALHIKQYIVYIVEESNLQQATPSLQQIATTRSKKERRGSITLFFKGLCLSAPGSSAHQVRKRRRRAGSVSGGLI